MKALVIDASATLAWCIPDERSGYGIQVARLVVKNSAQVPLLWQTEITNGLLFAERKSRMSPSEVDFTLLELAKMPIEIIAVENDAVLALARQHHLTMYDATYLKVALLSRSILATLDKELKKAAKALGIELFCSI